LRILRLFPSPRKHWSVAVHGCPSRPPWLSATGPLSILLRPRWAAPRVPLGLLSVFPFLPELPALQVAGATTPQRRRPLFATE
jgi:hypothetical protein